MLTIVVPVYNKEKYISKCLDSIINQTYREIDILLIDDGSTDNSGIICDEYMKKDGRIRVIHKENEGLVSTRKLAAIEANTELISFVDSDDWIESDFVEKMITPLLKDPTIDVVVSSIIMEKKGVSIIRKGTIPAGNYKDSEIRSEIIPNMMYCWDVGEFGIMGSVCGKIYRRELFSEIVNTIDDRITYGEDDALVYTLIPKCKDICVLDDGYYHYCIEPNTMATSFSHSSFEKLNLLKEHFIGRFSKYGLWPELMPEVNQIIWMFLHQALNGMFGISLGYQFPFEKIIKDSRLILYGAGIIGMNYHNFLKGTGYAEIVAWTDRAYISKRKEGLNVCNPDEVDFLNCDYVVICIEAKEIANEIINDLLKKGVPREKIFWETPKFLYS